MSTSGTFNFGLFNSSVVFEAFDRIGIEPPNVTQHMLISARVSMNLELIDWENETFNFWKLASGTINLVAGQATYTLPSSLVTLEELWYTTVNALGSGINSDRAMTPIQRTQYSLITNKLQPGIPTQYWFQMLEPPQVTIWEVPAPGEAAPNFVLNWYGLQQMQDVANLGGGETPDVPRRAFDALCAKMALRLCEKFGPKDAQLRQMMMAEKKIIADDAWNKLQRRDQEPGPIIFRPNIGAYGRMG